VQEYPKTLQILPNIKSKIMLLSNHKNKMFLIK